MIAKYLNSTRIINDAAKLNDMLNPRDIKIPYLKFKSKWEVQIVFPFIGAYTRFYIKYKGREVSVYLDIQNVLGCYYKDIVSPPIPYWEIYPLFGDNPETVRIPMMKTKTLIKEIKKLFKNEK